MRRFVLGLVVVSLLAAGCSGAVDDAGDDGSSTGGSGGAATSSAEALAPLTGTTLVGDPFDAAALEGKGVVLWFWAPWCTICRGEAPEVAAVADEVAGDVTVIGVPGLGPRGDMEDFVADTGVGGLTHLPDDDGKIWQAYRIIGQPAFVFITPSGEVTTFTGALGGDKLRDAVETNTLDS